MPRVVRIHETGPAEVLRIEDLPQQQPQRMVRVQPEEPHPQSLQRIATVHFSGSRRCDVDCDVTTSKLHETGRELSKSFDNSTVLNSIRVRNRRLADRWRETTMNRPLTPAARMVENAGLKRIQDFGRRRRFARQAITHAMILDWASTATTIAGTMRPE